jgi:hypothetical protein
VIQYFSDLEGHRLDLTLKLLSSVCGCPIYHLREFQTIQTLYSARPYYWPYSRFQECRTILGFLQFEEGASVFELHTSGGGFPCLDLSLGRVWQHQEVYIFRRVEPLVSLSSAGRTNNHQGRTSCLRGGRNPGLAVSVHLLLAAFGRLDLYLREHFVYSSIIVLKPSTSDLLLYCMRCFLSYNKVQLFACGFYLV